MVANKNPSGEYSPYMLKIKTYATARSDIEVDIG